MGAFVRSILGTDFFQELSECNASVDDPVGKFLDRVQRTEVNNAVPGITNEFWDAEKHADAAPSEKNFSNPLKFSKASIGYSLGIVRIQEELIDGERWNFAYNRAGECVGSRLITD